MNFHHSVFAIVFYIYFFSVLKFAYSFLIPPHNEYCKPNIEYTITSYNSLLHHANNLECIFAAALIPDKIPTGMISGKMIRFGNTIALNGLINSVYEGDIVYEAECNQNKVFIGEVRVAGSTVGIGELKLKTSKDSDPILSEELFDSHSTMNGLIYDFNGNIFERCSAFFENKFNKTQKYLSNWYKKNTYPTNIFIDVLRVVGRDIKDNGLIFLGRTFVRNPLHQIKSAKRSTAYFFMLKTLDPTINSDFKAGTSLRSVEHTFSFSPLPSIKTFWAANPLLFLFSKFFLRNTDAH